MQISVIKCFDTEISLDSVKRNLSIIGLEFIFVYVATKDKSLESEMGAHLTLLSLRLGVLFDSVRVV